MPANASISYSSSRFADIIGACLMVVSHVAHAAPPPDADMSLAPWFHSLMIPNTGSSCCGAADCRNYPVVVASDGYRVQFRGQWLKVPPAVVQDCWDNPTGDYVTCISDAATGSGGQKTNHLRVTICSSPTIRRRPRVLSLDPSG
jgi:hypothetical protein